MKQAFLVQTLLVFEFVVSPTHDYTTFSDYGSDVCINYLLFAFLLLTSHRFVQRYSDHVQRQLLHYKKGTVQYKSYSTILRTLSNEF